MPCPQPFQHPIQLTEETAGSRQVTAGHPKLIQVAPTLVHVAVPNTATILDTLAMVLGGNHAVLVSANVFFSRETSSICLHMRSNDGPFKCSSEVPCTTPLCVTEWRPEACPPCPSHTGEWAHCIHTITWTCEDVSLWQAILQALLKHLWKAGW